MRVAEAVSLLTAKLRVADIENPYYEAELLLTHFLNIDRAKLHMTPETEITSTQWSAVNSALERRQIGEPMAYILGHRDFYKHRFSVGPGVLIPRPETELIVESAVEKGPFRVIADIGCGSGCIGLSLLGEFPDSRLWACDVSPEALKYCEENAKQLNFMDRIEYSLGDVTDDKSENRYELVVSNPPYIDRADTRVADDVRKFEPAQALFAEENGLACYKSWLPWAHRALKNGGWAMFEFGEGQGRQVAAIARESGFVELELKKDLSGKERAVCARKGN